MAFRWRVDDGPLIVVKKIDVQISEQTEKARTDSTGRPGDPDFIFFVFQILKRMLSDSLKYRFR